MKAMMIKHADLYTPEHVGIRDMLIANDRIVAIGTDLEFSMGAIETIDLQGRIAIPGLIDQHVHSIGGGGEDGYASRVPPLRFSDCVKAGVTTLVGLLGTDSRTRSLADLLAMTKGLTATGITSYCLTGAYEYPSPTLTGSVGNDIIYIAEVLGVKLAISDHRCSNPTQQELVRLASEVRIAALLSKKPGVVHLHVGAAEEGIEKILRIVSETPIPAKHFRPTHMGRHLDQALEFAARFGGYVDITAGEASAAQAKSLLDKGCPPNLLTLSSDSNGSFPKWNERKEIMGMTYGKMTSLFSTIRNLVSQEGLPLEQALPFVTENVSRALELFPRKGVLQEGADADFVVLDSDLSIKSVMAKGRWLSYEGKILVTGMYEE
jgi:beta-aspartyl-dipeptidase (metallo-type)